MKYCPAIAGLLIIASCASAQAPNPFISDLKYFYTVRKGDLLKAVDRMPAEQVNGRLQVVRVDLILDPLAHSAVAKN